MSWNRWKPPEVRAFHDKTWRRSELAAWDARWLDLSPEARVHVLTQVKAPALPRKARAHSAPADRFPPHVLEELVAAGFVEVRPAPRSGMSAQVFAVDTLFDFFTRVRALHRRHLLAADQPSELEAYVHQAFVKHGIEQEIFRILHAAGISENLRLEGALPRYVCTHRWPGWVARSLRNPTAEALLAVVRDAPEPLPLRDLAARIPGSDAGSVRSALDALMNRLALFEDLHLVTHEILVGLLPAVRADLVRSLQPRRRPELRACPSPREVGPEGGFAVNDLRVLLLELASEPGRLRQDGELYQKEEPRFLQALEPLPGWLSQALQLTPEGRLRSALRWARRLHLVTDKEEEGQRRLRLVQKGSRWLNSRMEEQYATFYTALRGEGERDPEAYYHHDESTFLGSAVRAVEAGKAAQGAPWQDTPAEREALRNALWRSLHELAAGTFYRLDSVLGHLSFGRHNPLLLGHELERVRLFWNQHAVPPLEERYEEVGRQCLDLLVRGRLMPLGCVRTGIDADGNLCIARHPRLEMFFGGEADPADLPAEVGGEPRVIVQPDFSVVVIGLNPAPAAELAPFTERVRGHVGQGALELRITREAVIKAVAQGFDAAEVLARLRRHASNELPANVLHEVKEWCGWVRKVRTAPVLLLRCPDRDTADRVAGVLGRQAERLSDTVVALPEGRLSTAERNKLRHHGVIVQTGGAG